MNYKVVDVCHELLFLTELYSVNILQVFVFFVHQITKKVCVCAHSIIITTTNDRVRRRGGPCGPRHPESLKLGDTNPPKHAGADYAN